MGVDNPGTLLRNGWRLCHSSSPCLLSVFVPTDGSLTCVGVGGSQDPKSGKVPLPIPTSVEVFVMLNNGSYVDHDW